MTGNMIHIPVKNKELISILDQYPALIQLEDFEKNLHLTAREHQRKRHYYVGENHMNEIVGMGTNHDGFPDQLVGYDLKTNSLEHVYFEGEVDSQWRLDFTKKLGYLNTEMMSFLGTKNNALTCIYPPGGFISWHNNANAAAYNLIFTWSENGNGWFKYIDPDTKRVVTVKDEPGWQCKAAYFGHYGEPDRLMYHAASTDCWRCTVSYTFSIAEASREFREEVLEDISSE